MHNSDLIRRVTANFIYWQGLRIVPAGLFLVVFGLGSLRPNWWPVQTDAASVGGIVATAALLGVSVRHLNAYYGKVFGLARQLPTVERRRFAVKWFLFLPVLLATAVFDLAARWPIAVSGLVWAAAIIVYWASTGRGRPHWLGAAAVLAAASAAPVAGIVEAGRPAVWLLLAVLGVVYIVCGISDHVALTRVFPRRGAHVGG